MSRGLGTAECCFLKINAKDRSLVHGKKQPLVKTKQRCMRYTDIDWHVEVFWDLQPTDTLTAGNLFFYSWCSLCWYHRWQRWLRGVSLPAAETPGIPCPPPLARNEASWVIWLSPSWHACATEQDSTLTCWCNDAEMKPIGWGAVEQTLYTKLWQNRHQIWSQDDDLEIR